MREDERWFFEEVCKYCSNHGWSEEVEALFRVIVIPPPFPVKTKNHFYVRDIINLNPHRIQYKRAWYLLEKWCEKNWYEYGTTLDLGWITKEGNEIYLDMIKENGKDR